MGGDVFLGTVRRLAKRPDMTREEADRWARDYMRARAGQRPVEIAQESGLRVETVRKWAQRFGVRLAPQFAPKPDPGAAWLQEHAEQTTVEISELLGCDGDWARELFKRHGVKHLGRHKQSPHRVPIGCTYEEGPKAGEPRCTELARCRELEQLGARLPCERVMLDEEDTLEPIRGMGLPLEVAV